MKRLLNDEPGNFFDISGLYVSVIVVYLSGVQTFWSKIFPAERVLAVGLSLPEP